MVGGGEDRGHDDGVDKAASKFATSEGEIQE
jgi:hypothetical protein